MDGANIEIANAIGRENMFVFGASSEEVAGLRHTLKTKGEQAIDERLLDVCTSNPNNSYHQFLSIFS